MTVNYSIAATVLVAIDISKHRHEVLIGVPGKKRRRRMTIMNTLEDFQRLSAALVNYGLSSADRVRGDRQLSQAAGASSRTGRV